MFEVGDEHRCPGQEVMAFQITSTSPHFISPPSFFLWLEVSLWWCTHMLSSYVYWREDLEIKLVILILEDLKKPAVTGPFSFFCFLFSHLEHRNHQILSKASWICTWLQTLPHFIAPHPRSPRFAIYEQRGTHDLLVYFFLHLSLCSFILSLCSSLHPSLCLKYLASRSLSILWNNSLNFWRDIGLVIGNAYIKQLHAAQEISCI